MPFGILVLPSPGFKSRAGNINKMSYFPQRIESQRKEKLLNQEGFFFVCFSGGLLFLRRKWEIKQGEGNKDIIHHGYMNAVHMISLVMGQCLLLCLG